MNLLIEIHCNAIANKVLVTPIIRTEKATNQTSFYQIDGVWWSKKAGTLKPDAYENDMSHAEWMRKMRDECVEEVEVYVGRTCEETINGKAVYIFPDRDAAMGFAESLAIDCDNIVRG